MTVTHVVEYGNLLAVLFNGGTKVLAYPAGNDFWTVGNNADGVKSIQRIGNQLAVNRGTARDIGYQAATGVWLVTAGTGGPVDPGSGEWLWPFSLEYIPDLGEFGPRSGVGVGNFHEGIDFSNFANVTGKPIGIIHGGTVQFMGSSSSYGFYGIIHHGTFGGNDLKSLYAHFPSAGNFSVGQTVATGDIIGIVGSSGDATGPHLHLETHVCSVGGSIIHNTTNNGNPRTAVNPRDFFATYNA